METIIHSAMQENESSSTAQDCVSHLTETPGSLDGASRLLQLSRLAQELGAELSPRRHLNSQRGSPKDVSMLLVSASSSAVNLPCSMPWSVTRLFRPGCSSHSGAYCGSVWRRTSRPRAHARRLWQDIAISALKEYVTEELNPRIKGRGRRRSICAQPIVVLRHVFCGYAGFGFGLHWKYSNHAGVHSSH